MDEARQYSHKRYMSRTKSQDVQVGGQSLPETFDLMGCGRQP